MGVDGVCYWSCFFPLWFINVAPEADHFDVDNLGIVVDGIDDPDIANSQPEAALQCTTERFYIVVVARVFR